MHAFHAYSGEATHPTSGAPVQVMRDAPQAEAAAAVDAAPAAPKASSSSAAVHDAWADPLAKGPHGGTFSRAGRFAGERVKCGAAAGPVPGNEQSLAPGIALDTSPLRGQGQVLDLGPAYKAILPKPAGVVMRTTSRRFDWLPKEDAQAKLAQPQSPDRQENC